MFVIWNIVIIGIKLIFTSAFNVILVINYMMMDYVEFVKQYVVHHQIISLIPYVISVIYLIAFNVSIFNELIRINYNKIVHNVNLNST